MMMMSVSLLVQASVLALAGAFTIIHHPILFQPLQHAVVSGYKEITMRSDDASLPCPGQGFYVHPHNCTKFYRCVDFTGTGTLYSRYLFECPKGHVFLTVAQTCVPGVCTGLVQPVVPPPVMPANPPVSPPGPISTEAPTLEVCPNTYVQHPMYCNLYHPCNQPKIRYTCPTGTAFDQPRQMCRISAQDDGLCTGKQIFKHPFLLRSENIGEHIRLPDSILIPTALSSGHQQSLKPTASPLQLYIWPTARPVGALPYEGIAPTFEVGGPPVFRPLISRPAQTYNRPTSSHAPFHSAFDTAAVNTGAINSLHPVQVKTSAIPPGSTKLRPLAEVRRPLGHLHFPGHYPLAYFGFQGTVAED